MSDRGPRVLRVFASGAFFLAVCAGMFSWLCSFDASDAWSIYCNRSQYIDREYRVTGAHYSIHGSGDDGSVLFWIEGEIDGRSEKLTTDQIMDARSQADIERVYPPDTLLKVKYDPSQGEASHALGGRRVILDSEFQERMTNPLWTLAGMLTLTLVLFAAWAVLRWKAGTPPSGSGPIPC